MSQTTSSRIGRKKDVPCTDLFVFYLFSIITGTLKSPSAQNTDFRGAGSAKFQNYCDKCIILLMLNVKTYHDTV